MRKRLISYILSLTLVLSSVLGTVGCGESVHILTRGEWINVLASMYGMNTCYDSTPIYTDVKETDPYFNQIQACAEWGIIEKKEKFLPNERATVEFAIITAVKSIGLEKIERSVGGRKLASEGDILTYFEENSENKYSTKSALYADVAYNVLIDTRVISNNMIMEQYQSVEYKENVYVLDEEMISFSMDGQTATLDTTGVELGDIIIVEPSVVYPTGKYAKVTSISENQITYIQPELGEVINHLEVYGTYEPEILGIVPLAEGVEIVPLNGENELVPQVYRDQDGNEKTMYVSATKCANGGINLGNFEVKITPATLGPKYANVAVEGAIRAKDVTVSADVEMWGPVVTKADIKVTETVEAKASIVGKVEGTFPIIEMPVSLWGIITGKLVFAVKIGAEGKVSVVASVDTVESLNYEVWKVPQYYVDAKNPELFIEARAKVYVKPEIKVKIDVLGVELASMGIYSGGEVLAKADSKYPDCMDLTAYVPLAIYVGAEGKENLLGLLGVKYTWTIWTASTSPIQKKWHLENWEIVDACTKKNSQNEGEQENSSAWSWDWWESLKTFMAVDEETEAEMVELTEYQLGLQISSYCATLEEGTKDSLLVTQLPESYSMADIIYQSSDTRVAQVDSDGNVTAVSQGQCIIKVATKDGSFEQYCTVNVRANYDVDFTPLDPMWYDKDENEEGTLLHIAMFQSHQVKSA